MNIALLGKYFGWGGGAEFLRFVASGLLAKQREHDLKLYLLLPMHRLDSIRVVKRSFLETLSRKRLSFVFSKPDFYLPMLDYFEAIKEDVQFVYYDNTPRSLFQCLKRIGADVAIPINGLPGPDFPIPWVGYLPDFQHKYYPENFTVQECFKRDIQYATALRDSKSVVVHSMAAKNDILKYYPYVKTNIFPLPFSPLALASWFDACDSNVRAKYGLPDSYFLISNQFWRHKDHLTAFKSLLIDRNACLVCTGEMIDYNYPGHIDNLKTFIRTEGLTERIRLLGHLPKREQIEIMKKARAVIQPSLFEGSPGGLCAYDAAGLGVPLILSNTEVNREVDAEHSYFYEAGNHQDLAEKMMFVSHLDIKRIDKETLLSRGRINAEKLGETLMEAIRHSGQ